MVEILHFLPISNSGVRPAIPEVFTSPPVYTLAIKKPHPFQAGASIAMAIDPRYPED